MKTLNANVTEDVDSEDLNRENVTEDVSPEDVDRENITEDMNSNNITEDMSKNVTEDNDSEEDDSEEDDSEEDDSTCDDLEPIIKKVQEEHPEATEADLEEYVLQQGDLTVEDANMLAECIESILGDDDDDKDDTEVEEKKCCPSGYNYITPRGSSDGSKTCVSPHDAHTEPIPCPKPWIFKPEIEFTNGLRRL